MTENVTRSKPVLEAADSILIHDAATDTYKVTPAGNLSIHSITLTGTDPLTRIRTYTIWRDPAETVVAGTFQNVDGIDGTGISIPTYTDDAYEVNECVVDGGLLYRCIAAAALGSGTPSTTPALWEPFQVGGVNLIHDPTADYAIGDVVLQDGVFFTPFNNIAASAGAPLPFVEGYADDHWYNIAGGVFRHWGITGVYAVDEVVRFGNLLYQSNSIILAGVAFAIGTEVNEWRIAGSSLPRAVFLGQITGGNDDDIIPANTLAGTGNALFLQFNTTLVRGIVYDPWIAPWIGNESDGSFTIGRSGVYHVVTDLQLDRDGDRNGEIDSMRLSVVRFSAGVELDSVNGRLYETTDEMNHRDENGNNSIVALDVHINCNAGDQLFLRLSWNKVTGGTETYNPNTAPFSIVEI